MMHDDPVASSLREAADRAVRHPLSISLDEVRAKGDYRRGRSRRRRRIGVAVMAAAVLALIVVPLPRLHIIGSEHARPAGGTGTTAPARRWHVVNYRGAPYRFDHPTTVFTGGGRVFVSNAHSVTELDASNGAFVRTISGRRDHFSSAPSPAGAVAFDGAHLWVTSGRDSLTEIDAGDGAWVRTLHGDYGFDLPVGGAFDGTDIWFANQGSNTVTEIDASNGALVRVLSSPAYQFNDPDAMALTGSHLWIVNGETPSVSEINVHNGSLVRVLAGGRYGFDAPISIAFDGKDLWVVNYYEGDSLTEFAASDGAWVRTMSARELGVQIPFSVASADGQVWLGANVVAEINPRTGRTEQTFARPSQAFEQIFDVAAGGGRVWVTNPGNDSVTGLCQCQLAH